MVFRVWNKTQNQYDTNPIALEQDGQLSIDGVIINEKDFDVEFNTGIILADGTETFFGDIIRWKDKFKLRDNYIRHNKVFFEDGYVYSVIRPSNLFDLTENWLCEGNVWNDDIELVGNIHETELTGVLWNKN